MTETSLLIDFKGFVKFRKKIGGSLFKIDEKDVSVTNILSIIKQKTFERGGGGVEASN